MDTTEIHRQLCEAIERHSLVMFEYADLIRVVEPHRFGVNSAGHEMLSGWLRAGYSRSDPAGGWRNYLVSDISALQVLDAPFAGTRPGYAAHDPRMREVFSELAVWPPTVAGEGPYVVREPEPAAARTSAADTAPPTEAGSHPSEHPAEAARTRDGEIDPPEAVS
jgi:hypothetical protein